MSCRAVGVGTENAFSSGLLTHETAALNAASSSSPVRATSVLAIEQNSDDIIKKIEENFLIN